MSTSDPHNAPGTNAPGTNAPGTNAPGTRPHDAPDLTAVEAAVLAALHAAPADHPADAPAPNPIRAALRDVVRYQHRHNPALARFWDLRGFDPSGDIDPDLIPAVPTDVFRHVRLASDEAPARVTFRTSGTTSGQRGEHHHISTRCYDAGALLHARRLLPTPPGGWRFVNLTFPPDTHPDSSLSHMVALFVRELGDGDPSSARFHLGPSGIDASSVREALQRAAHDGAPCLVFGTAFALADVLDLCPPVTLPPGSVVIETGGFKGRREALEPSAFRDAISRQLGVPTGRIMSEYGMTELSSQLYTRLQEQLGSLADVGQPTNAGPLTDVAALAGGAAQPISLPDPQPRLLVPPPWLLVRACDPEDLRPLPSGETGILRFVDLCNVDSVVAVQTSDVGRVTPGGVELLGRAPGSTPRGCSLAIEELRR